MAAINCPHCNNEIDSCPYCGGSFKDTPDEPENAEVQEDLPPRVPLGLPKRNLPLGLGGTVSGVFGLIYSLFLVISSKAGLVVLLASTLAIVGGSALIIGAMIVDCPSCGKKMYFMPNSQRVTCNHCKTSCVCKDDYLEMQ